MKRRNKKVLREANRSGKMPCQICSSPELLVCHHINGREIQGAEEEWNKCYICSNDHSKIHAGIIIIEGWFTTNQGRTLLWHYNGDESITGTEAKPYVR